MRRSKVTRRPSVPLAIPWPRAASGGPGGCGAFQHAIATRTGPRPRTATPTRRRVVLSLSEQHDRRVRSDPTAQGPRRPPGPGLGLRRPRPPHRPQALGQPPGPRQGPGRHEAGQAGRGRAARPGRRRPAARQQDQDRRRADRALAGMAPQRAADLAHHRGRLPRRQRPLDPAQPRPPQGRPAGRRHPPAGRRHGAAPG
jgi:hypothetical protein